MAWVIGEKMIIFHKNIDQVLPYSGQISEATINQVCGHIAMFFWENPGYEAIELYSGDRSNVVATGYRFSDMQRFHMLDIPFGRSVYFQAL